MSDYISREAFLERVDGIWECCRSDDCASCKWRETKNAIRKIAAYLPAADVRPVVLCKNCKYFYKDADGYTMCDNSEGYDHVTEDDFCSRGADMREES